MKLIKPPALRAGDRIAVIAPSSPFPAGEFDAGIAELRSLGLEPVFDDRVFARDGYVAGDAVSRARAFLEAWTDPSVRAIACARGGYGSAQLLPWLSAEVLRRTPTLLIGYSDVTALLAFVTTRCGMTAVHGPTVAGPLAGGAGGYDRGSLLDALGVAPAGAAGRERAVETLKNGAARGPLFGGNLTQLAATLGTPYAFDPPPGCVLFLEDVNERPYRLDRMLTQLQQAGILSRAAGLVFGEMPGCDEPDGSVRAIDAVARCLREFAGPVAWGLSAGHAARPAVSLPLGVPVSLACGRRALLTVEESAAGEPGPAGGGAP